MTGYLVQAISEEATADIGLYTQELFNELLGIDIMLAFKMLAFWSFFIWVIFALWVAFDASSRYKSWQASLFWFVFVLPFNLIGFIGYLFMRPIVTLEDKQWTNLEGKFLMQELSNVNDCPSCGTLVGADHNFCAVCGTQMKVTCSPCGTSQSIYNAHCRGCGVKMHADDKTVEHYKTGQIEDVSKAKNKKKLKFDISKAKSFFSSLVPKKDMSKKEAKKVKRAAKKASMKEAKKAKQAAKKVSKKKSSKKKNS